jgi:hypothetical protein
MLSNSKSESIPSIVSAGNAGQNKMPQRSRAFFVFAIFIILLISETLASFSIVGIAYIRGSNNHPFMVYSISQTLHIPKLLLLPFLPDIPMEIKTGARYVANVVSRKYIVDVADGMLGWRLSPSRLISEGFTEEGHMISEYTGSKDSVFSWRFTNAQGFSSSGDLRFNYTKEKPPNTYRIIILGGSTVEGLGAESYDQTLPAWIKKILSEEIPLIDSSINAVEVINAGVSGYYSSIEYLYLLTELTAYSPDLVIQYDGLNDATELSKVADRGITVRDFPLPDSYYNNNRRLQKSYSFLDSLALAAHLGPIRLREFLTGFSLGFALDYFWNRYFNHPSKVSDSIPKPNPISSPVSAEIMIRNWERSIALADTMGFRIALFLQPVLGVDDHEPYGKELWYLENGANYYNLLRSFYGNVRPLVKKLSDRHYDHSRVCIADISKESLAGVQGRVYVDANHLLGRGNKAVAEALISRLRVCGILPSASASRDANQS